MKDLRYSNLGRMYLCCVNINIINIDINSTGVSVQLNSFVLNISSYANYVEVRNIQLLFIIFVGACSLVHLLFCFFKYHLLFCCFILFICLCMYVFLLSPIHPFWSLSGVLTLEEATFSFSFFYCCDCVLEGAQTDDKREFKSKRSEF